MLKPWFILASLALGIGAHAQIHIGPAQPFANIGAAALAAHAGDTIFVHAGSYEGYQWVGNLHGTSAQWIVVAPYKNDAIVINGEWQFTSCSFMRFQNLNFAGNTAYPGRFINVDNAGDCATNSHHIVFDSCSFTDETDSTAICVLKFGGVDTFQVSHCIFRNLATDAFDFNVCHEGKIFENSVSNCTSAGHIKGGSSNIAMERNLFVNASSGTWVVFELGGDTGDQFYCKTDSFEVNNLSFNANLIVGGYRGVALSSATNCEIINNTFYDCGQATIRVLCVSHLYPKDSGNNVENNLFAFGAAAYFNIGPQLDHTPQPASAVTFANNIYYSNTGATFAGPYWDSPEGDSIKESNPKLYGSATAMFVDSAKHDFHLAAGSPAIGAGKSEITPSEDYYGYVFKSPRSIGAVEYNSVKAGVEIPNLVERKFAVLPNPSTQNHFTVAAFDAAINANVRLVEIVSMNGSVVRSLSVRQLPVEISTSGLPRGTYVVRVVGVEIFEGQKIVVQ